MIRFLTSDALAANPELADGMFRDRAAQFRGRLGWPVQVDAGGRERDQYDPLQAVYIIWQMPDGSHGGSMRAMPTTGRTMAAEHFADICGGPISDPDIWECTRLALAPGAPRHVAAALMLGGQIFGMKLGLKRAVGVFDAPMTRVYARLGWAPEPLGRRGDARTGIGAGLWSFGAEIRDRLAARAGICPRQAEAWFARDLGHLAPVPQSLPQRAPQLVPAAPVHPAFAHAMVEAATARAALRPAAAA